MILKTETRVSSVFEVVLILSGTHGFLTMTPFYSNEGGGVFI